MEDNNNIRIGIVMIFMCILFILGYRVFPGFLKYNVAYDDVGKPVVAGESSTIL